MHPPLTLSAHGATDVGRKRTTNEDAVLVRDDLALYLVADGVGGRASGEIASRLALRSIENFFGATVKKTHEKPEFDRLGIARDARRLASAVQKANQDVLEVAETTPEHRGMGTTVVAACFSPSSALLHVAHVGDSRCYRLRGEHLELLTQDHSLVTDILAESPQIEDDVLERIPTNIVTRALGMNKSLRVSLRSYAVVAGDKYLLSSDGLHGLAHADELAETLARGETPEASVKRLIELANAAGGTDNISALVIECHGGPSRGRPPEEFAEPADPELLILGIEELELGNVLESDTWQSLGALLGAVGNR